MDEEQKIRNELLAKYRDDILRRQLSNNENYDKAVLSLGTAFLGFSMAFLKDFVSYQNATCAPLLPISWVLFCFSIVATVASFFISQKGLSTQLEYAENYYLKNDQSYLAKINPAARWTDWVNYGSALSFVLAIISTIFFVVLNLVNGANMPEKRNYVIAQDAASIPRMQQFNRGASIPAMQQTSGGIGSATAGAQIPVMQAAPVATPTTTQPASGSSSQNSGSTPATNGGSNPR